MKVVGSIKNHRQRDKNSKVVKRGKRILVINKKKPRLKVVQGKNKK